MSTGIAPHPQETNSGVALRILVVEDELHLATGLLYNLQAEGYSVEVVHDGETALELLGITTGQVATGQSVPAAEGAQKQPANTSRFDAVLLDVMLPGKSGFDVVSALRAEANYVPVLMLTARGRPEDILSGLEAGADDYLPKPFDLDILLVRLRVLLRRMQWQRSSAPPAALLAEKPGEPTGELPAVYEFSGRMIDFDQLELTAKGEHTRLTLMEADFLRYLTQNPFRIIPRKELLEQVWRVHEDTDTRAIDNFVVRLRRYMEDEPTNPVYLKTVRGVGYRFLPNGE